MRTLNIITTSAVFLLSPRTTLAEEVTLPAPVLEWSFYILLIFAALVAIGIFIFAKGKNGRNGPNGKDGEYGENRKNGGYETMSSLLDEHDPTIYSVRPNVSVSECIREMNAHRIGAMLVMVENQLLGIFTERDAIRRVLGTGLDPTVTNVSKVMSKNLINVKPSTTVNEAMGIVTNMRVRHLPVIENGKVLGMVSSGDLTHNLVKDQAGEIQELVDIAGRRGAST